MNPVRCYLNGSNPGPSDRPTEILAHTAEEPTDGTDGRLPRLPQQMMCKGARYVNDHSFSFVHSQENNLSTAPEFTHVLTNCLVKAFKGFWGDNKIFSLKLNQYVIDKAVSDHIEVSTSDVNLSFFEESCDKLVNKYFDREFGFLCL
ncbi:hypothetical protein ABVT39_004208 [Epinephelus coioides]